mgnify:CR=1 FL=1
MTTSAASGSIKKLADLWSMISATTDEPPVPYQIISGSGYGWFFDPTEKKMTRLARGAEIMQISKKPDSRGKVLARTEHRYIMISPDEIIDVGYN